MAVKCVNMSSPEFKGLLGKTHFSKGTLKSIIHEYQNTPDLWEKNQGLWPSDDYVLNYFNRRFAGTPAQIAVWKGRFMSPHIYDTYQEAVAEKEPTVLHNMGKNSVQFFQTKVQMTCSSKGKGKISISFNNEDELERIMNTLDSVNNK